MKPWHIFLLFQKKLPDRYNFKRVCKICYKNKKTVKTPEPKEGKRCPTHGTDWVLLQVHCTSDPELEIRPMPAVKNPRDYNFSPCKYFQAGKCWQKDKCKWTHNQHELRVWKAEQAIQHPRLNPPPKSTNGSPKLCQEMHKRYSCRNCPTCPGAHSMVELKIWKSTYEKMEQNYETRGELSEYRRTGFNCENLLIAKCQFLLC